MYLNGEKVEGNLIIPEGVERIAPYAFYGQDIISVTIPASVTSINSSAFYGCENLQQVNFVENSNLTAIDEYAFGSCDELEKIILPQKLTTIGYCSLTGKNLKVVIPTSVTRIHYGAFSFSVNEWKAMLFYCGNAEQWDSIDIHSSLQDLLPYYYVENEQDVPDDDGNYWHYDTDNKTPIIWE